MLKRTPMSRTGKSSRSRERQAWDRQLKAEWATKGIYRCEQCGGTFALNLAHSLKRRFITTKEQYWTVALLCQRCHEFLDNKCTHEEMEQVIKEIIAKREQ